MEHKQNGFKIISNKKQPLYRMFNAELLEILAKTDVKDAFYFYTLPFFYFFYKGLKIDGIVQCCWEFLIGLFIWTIIEYALHRFFYHYHATNEKWQKLLFPIHAAHHAYPRQTTATAAPLLITFPIFILLIFLNDFLFGEHAHAYMAGMISGYLTYEILHYAAHHFKPNNSILRYLKRHHLSHHYIQNNKCFSISFPLWDYVFKTQSLNHQTLPHCDNTQS